MSEVSFQATGPLLAPMNLLNTMKIRQLATLALTCLSCTFGSLAASAQATNVTITTLANNVGYTSDYAALGYTFGNTYTFTFTLLPNVGPNGNGEAGFSSYYNTYRSESAAEGDFFSAITGTGVTGNYVVPADTNRFLDLGVSNNGGIPMTYITVGSNSTGLGIKMIDGTSQVTRIDFLVNDPNVSFTYPGDVDDGATYIDPATFFYSNFNAPGRTISGGEAGGEFQTSFGLIPRFWVSYSTGLGGDSSVGFTPVSITMTQAAAVPEPSTYAALAGLAALGLAVWRRRQQATA